MLKSMEEQQTKHKFRVRDGKLEKNQKLYM